MEDIKNQLSQIEKRFEELYIENYKLREENQQLKSTFSKVLTLFKSDFEEVLKASPINLLNNNKVKQNEYNYQLIDLGLPSGTLWMDRNVGASSPEDAGLYFAWGETIGYTADEVGKTKQFSWDDYKYANGAYNKLTKYCNKSSYGNDGYTDSLTTLETTDDAVLQNVHKYSMPTKEQLQELIDGTTSTWTTQNGVNGRLFTSKTNGNSIFVPAAGYGSGGSMYNVGSYGYLWSSSLYEDYTNNAWGLYFYSDYVDLYDDDRCGGRSVRGVVAASK